MTTTVLELRNVSKRFDQAGAMVVAADDITLRIQEGETVALVGPSGCGKSTILKVAGLLISPSSGCVFINGTEAPTGDARRATIRNQEVGFVYQDFAIVESLSAVENIELPLHYASPRVPRKVRRERALNGLRAVRMEDKERVRVAELSGGQRQRVAIARSLIMDPVVILADEPTAALDAESADVVLDLLFRHSSLGTAVLMATHDMRVAKRCDRIVHMLNGRIA